MLKLPNTLLVGFIGKSGSGKDYVAKIWQKLIQEAGGELFLRAFADKIRNYIKEINPEIISYVKIRDLLGHNTWDDLKRTDFNFPFFSLPEHVRQEIVDKIRILVQTHGEAGREHFGVNHWINLVLIEPKKFDKLWESEQEFFHRNNCPAREYENRDFVFPRKILIKDVRRENEAKRIWGLGGHIIRITKDEIGLEEWRNHVTEMELDGIIEDWEIINDESVEENAFDALQHFCKLEIERIEKYEYNR